MPSVPKTIDSVLLANYLVAKIGPMPHLKLQKLVYYAQAWHLAILERPLVEDDFQAWAHGPVSRKIWDRFKSPEFPVMGTIALSHSEAKSAKRQFEANTTPDQFDLVNDVIKEYGDKSGYHLECLTHAEAPWIDARGGIDPAAKSTAVISQSSMKKFYRSRI